MVNSKKLINLFLISLMLAIIVIFSGCELGKTANVHEDLMVQSASAEEVCCIQYQSVDNEVVSPDGMMKVAPRDCCDYTSDPDACRTCVEEYVPPVRSSGGTSSSRMFLNILLPIFFIILVLGVISLILLIAHGIVKLASKTKKEFLNKGWLIALWIIFGATFVINIVIFLILITTPAYN